MPDYKTEILNKICFTKLVYGRVNKKLSLSLSKGEIENMVYEVIAETDKAEFHKKGKNIYVENTRKNVRLTINSFTHRLITADNMNEYRKRN